MTDMNLNNGTQIPVNAYLTILSKPMETLKDYEILNELFRAYENENCLFKTNLS